MMLHLVTDIISDIGQKLSVKSLYFNHNLHIQLGILLGTFEKTYSDKIRNVCSMKCTCTIHSLLRFKKITQLQTTPNQKHSKDHETENDCFELLEFLDIQSRKQEKISIILDNGCVHYLSMCPGTSQVSAVSSGNLQ